MKRLLIKRKFNNFLINLESKLLNIYNQRNKKILFYKINNQNNNNLERNRIKYNKNKNKHKKDKHKRKYNS